MKKNRTYCTNSVDPVVHLQYFDLSNNVCVIYFCEVILECSKNTKTCITGFEENISSDEGWQP